jgi:thioredoxin-like negative regulator of GroEL
VFECQEYATVVGMRLLLSEIVFSQMQAQKFYESALRSEPGFLGAVLALADLHGREGRNDEATVLLQQYLKNWADDSLHTKLAQILAATEKLGESLSHYQTALRYELSNKHRNRGLLLYVQIYSFGWYSL